MDTFILLVSGFSLWIGIVLIFNWLDKRKAKPRGYKVKSLYARKKRYNTLILLASVVTGVLLMCTLYTVIVTSLNTPRIIDFIGIPLFEGIGMYIGVSSIAPEETL